MATPAVEGYPPDSSMSESGVTQGSHKPSVTTDRPIAIKRETSQSPVSEPRPKGGHNKKAGSAKSGAVGPEDGGDSGAQQGSSRKKRSRATPCDDPDASGRKSTTDASGRESSLWPGGEGEGPVQGSLLEEVLAEKRMALMRSPQVMRFLQQRQMMMQAAQQHNLLHPHPNPHPNPHLCVGEVEEDANS